MSNSMSAQHTPGPRDILARRIRASRRSGPAGRRDANLARLDKSGGLYNRWFGIGKARKEVA